MPVFPASPVVFCEVVVKGDASSGGSSVTPSINVFHYRRTSTAPAFTKAALNTIFQTTVMTPMAAALNTRWSANEIFIRVDNDALDAPAGFAAAQVGAIATDSLPSDDAVYVLLRSALRGKSYRGSKHFGPASEVDTTNDILTGAGLARWQAVRDACVLPLTDALGNTWNPCVLSQKLSQRKVNPTTITYADIVEGLLDLNIGTMRRRRSQTVR